jgi:hypothetical protein
MNVTLPNGIVLENVPEGTSKEEIKRKAIDAGYATEADFVEPEVQPTFSERLEQLPSYSEQVRQRYEEFSPLDTLSQAVPEFQRRAEIIKEAKPVTEIERKAGIEETSLSAGEAVTLGISQAARTGGEIVVGAIDVLLPDAVRVGAEMLWDEIKDTTIVSAATAALNKGYEVYAQWKENNPADAEQFEAAVDVSILAMPQASLTKSARTARGQYNLNNIEEMRAGILRMMRPDNFEGAGEVIEAGPTRKKVYVPSDKEETVNLVLETVDDINPNRSYTYNHQVVDSAVSKADNELLAHIKRSGNPEFDIESVLTDMVATIEDFSNQPAYKLLSPDAQSKAKEFATVALEMLQNSKGDALSLLKVRREFDKFLTSGQRKVFDPTVESAKSAAGQHVRNVLNQTLKDITDGDETHHLLDRMHNLLIAKDRLREGRAKEGNNMFSRAWDTLKKRAMLPSTALGLAATGGVAGQLLTESALLGAGSGALLYAASRTMTKKNRLRFYAATLSAMDKAIDMYTDDKNLVAQLKVDRLLLVDLIQETRQEEEE